LEVFLSNSSNYTKDVVVFFNGLYKRAFDDKKTIWREWMGSTFVYRWILVNYNTGIIYYIFLTKENYENNRDNYLKDFLGTTH